MSYEDAVIEHSFQMVYESTGDRKYFKYMINGVDNIIDPSGNLLNYTDTQFSLDNLSFGHVFLYLWQATGDKRFKTVVETLRKQLEIQPRNREGGFWHRSNYPNQMWLDGQYMALPFYAEYTHLFTPGNLTAWFDILLQFELLELHVKNVTSGLLDHGYDASLAQAWANPITGASPHEWVRAMGWYTMALVDVLDFYPTSHPGFSAIKEYFISAMTAVRNAVDAKTGGWWLVMDLPGRKRNYIESSGTAMFIYCMLKGIRKGYLGKDFDVVAGTAYSYMTKEFVKPVVGGLGRTSSYESYVSVPLRENDLKGIAAAILASIEFEKN
ncbi:glycosyl hydrolase [Trichophaea hybrida]|nr:glycosyl hydrolase [Trichophaea hybrida]